MLVGGIKFESSIGCPPPQFLPPIAFFLLLFQFPSAPGETVELHPPPIVETRNGRVQGFRVELEPPPLLEEAAIVKEADIFLSIPFAQPPVDELRLERPLAPANWTDTLDATSIPPACVPQHVLAAPDSSEDCLYLNLFRPSSSLPSAPERQQHFPVVIFIHGGGFAVGGTFVEGYANISNNFVSQGLLVITIQYRLNFLGFFSDGTSFNPGNLGLWDQRQALIWIRQNVALFGGDADHITVWGQSAGAASVSLLSISPKTRDLFHQSIQISGTFLAPWAMNDRVVGTSMNTAISLGCAKGGKGQKECLKALELDDIVDGIQQLEIVRSDFAMVVYNPRVDNDFVPVDIGRALSSAPKKPTLMGFNPHESLFLTIHYPVSVFAFDSPLTVVNQTTYNRTQLVNFIRNCVQFGHNHQQQKDEDEEAAKQIAAQLEAFYAAAPAAKGKKDDWRHFLEQYTLLLSDIQFIVPFLAEARLKAIRDWPIFLYQFDHINREHAKKLPFRGIVHGSEYPYTFGTELFGNYPLDGEDRRVQALLLRTIGTFIKTGQPTSSPNLSWPSVGGRHSPLAIIRFDGPKIKLEMDPPALTKRLQFWRKLAKMRGFKRVQGFPRAVPST